MDKYTKKVQVDIIDEGDSLPLHAFQKAIEEAIAQVPENKIADVTVEMFDIGYGDGTSISIWLEYTEPLSQEEIEIRRDYERRIEAVSLQRDRAEYERLKALFGGETR